MADEKIDISKLDKAAVLAALYNASVRIRACSLPMPWRPVLTLGEARVELERRTDISYVWGRAMKVNLSGDTLDPYWYDQDNGQGAAAKAIDQCTGANGGPNHD